MSIHLKAPERSDGTPVITVFGVGGGGSNAVDNMIASNLQGVNFVVANTDAQALSTSLAEHKIQLGKTTMGAGADPQVGAAAAEESYNEIKSYIENSNMLFIAAGMGGGTGTGAAPVVARIAKELNILTVGVVTKPFALEGSQRMRIAEAGIAELQKYVNTTIVIPNQHLFRISNQDTTFIEAFKLADTVLRDAVTNITNLIHLPGLINLDFADIVTIISKGGKSMMGTGEASGEDRAVRAAEIAISNPLLDNSSIKKAAGVLIHITGGTDMTLIEVDEAVNRIRKEMNDDEQNNINIIFGSTFNPDLDGTIKVSVVASAISDYQPEETSRNIDIMDEQLAHLNMLEDANDTIALVNSSVENHDNSADNGNMDVNNTEDADKITQLQTHHYQYNNNLNPYNQHKDITKKSSIFKRMWNRIFDTSPPPTKNIHYEHNNITSSSKNNVEDNIYDIPTFLRKDKK